jgi:PiT family inorganic phosphate transporter
MLATILGFPISTTHALTGALVGAGVVAVGPQLDLSVFGRAFFLPLLVSPILSVFLAMSLYKFAHESRRRLGIEKETCVCVGPSQYVPLAQLAYDNGTRAFVRPVPSDGGFAVTVGTERDCVEVYRGHFASVTAQSTVNAVHCVSAIAVSFARGLNDLPKIVGVLLVAKVLDLHVGMIAIALAMALGGLINARNVAETMSKKISGMNDGQALTANIVTAVMVICASRFGMPVSTTHVSVGAISGVGLVKGTADRSVIVNILLSWVLTLPIAAAIAAAISAALAMVS